MPSTHDINVNVNVTFDKPPTWNGDGVAGKVVKADASQRYTLTVAYPANKPDAGVARDGHQDFASAHEVEQAAWNYMVKSRNVGLWHENGTDGAGEVVESYIYRGPDWTIRASDGSEQVVKAGDWLMGVRWSDDAWDQIQKGEIGGVSMQGKASRRTPSPLDMAHLRKQK